MTTHPTSGDATERAPRADARRNIARILDAAADAFATQGTDAPLIEIAKRAGVGSATLYRHFPTRQDLLVTLLRDRVDRLTAQARELVDDPSPRDALHSWLLAVAHHATTYRGLAGELMSTEESDVLFEVHRAMRTAGAALVQRAKEEKVLRADVTVAEVFQIVNAIAWATEQTTPGPEHIERLLDLVFDGLYSR